MSSEHPAALSLNQCVQAVVIIISTSVSVVFILMLINPSRLPFFLMPS